MTEERELLLRSLRLLDAFAGEGIFFYGLEEPIDICTDTFSFLGMSDEDIQEFSEQTHGMIKDEPEPK